MSLTSLPFQSLPFPVLFKDYISQRSELTNFFSAAPFSDKEIGDKIESFQFPGNRGETVKLLQNFNRQFNPSDETLNSVEQLSQENSLVVATGQQLTMFGGPLFTIYKTLTAIILAKKWQKKYKRPVIPVFWLADEDHDFEEVAKIGLPGADGLSEIILNSLGEGNEVAGDLVLNGSFPEFKKATKESLFDTDFSPDLWKILDECYAPETNIRTAFGKLLLSLFGKYGLVLAGSNDREIKEHIVQPLQKSVLHSEELYNILTKTTDKLIKAGYHGQVQVQESNLFWVDDNHQRKKIQVKNSRWFVEESGREWSAEELSEEIKDNPHRFSPNVFLRPVIQDKLLPVISYIAGPGELSYYAQMKIFYEHFQQDMPIIYPRFSATMLESGIQRNMDKLPFSFSDYSGRIEDLESGYVQKSDSVDVELLFSQWKEKSDELTENMKYKISEIDPTLEGSAGKASATYFTELDKLKGKVYRSIKQQEKVQLGRIKKVKDGIFPNRNLQEREVAFIYFMNKYGIDIWDTVLEQLDDEVPDSHKLINL